MDVSDGVVTAELVIAAILAEFHRTIEPSFFRNYARHSFRAYLYRDDFDRMSQHFKGMREEAEQALHRELKRLNGANGARLPFARKIPVKPCELTGEWDVGFLINEDDDAATNRLIVKSTIVVKPTPNVFAGAPTERVVKTSPADDGTNRTGRPFSQHAAAPAGTPVYARLTVQYSSGPVHFEVVKDVVKVGRGGDDEWVDLKLLITDGISRTHFQLKRDRATGRFFIKDLSKFGTSVNGALVPPSIEIRNGVETDLNREVELRDGDIISVADDVLYIRFKVLKTK